MDLLQLLIILHNGAFFAFETVVLHLPKSDLKTLRLLLGKPIADTILPYMFQRLFLSIHNEDLDVFQEVLNRPAVCRKIREVLWDTRLMAYNPIAAQNTTSLVRDCSLCETAENRVNCSGTAHQLSHVCHQAKMFLSDRATTWHQNELKQRDVKFASRAISELRNLRRINMFNYGSGNRRQPSGAGRQNCFRNSPRIRMWQKLSFSSRLPDLGLGDGPDDVACQLLVFELSFERAMLYFMGSVQYTGCRIGAVIVDVAHKPWDRRSTEFEDRDLSDPSKLTVRLTLELPMFTSALWQNMSKDQLYARTLCDNSWQNLEELTWSCANLTKYVEYFSRGPNSSAFAQYTSLRRLRLYASFCPNMAWFLRLLYKTSSIKEVELHAVMSISKSWYAVMQDLKTYHVKFGFLQLTNCRSPAEQNTLASNPVETTWSGDSGDVVSWLRGETRDFPLWQGPHQS